MKLSFRFVVPLSLLILNVGRLEGGETVPMNSSATLPPPPAYSPYAKGTFEFSLLAHHYWSFEFDGERPELNYFLGAGRFGWMLGDPSGEGMWRGNNQLLLEGCYGSVTEGPGDWLGGANLILRRNFIPRSERCVFYLQAGAGILWNDIHEDLSQTLIGRETEVSLLAGAGLRYQMNARWSLSAEVDYRHVSNADTAARNTGLDSIGGGLTLGWSF